MEHGGVLKTCFCILVMVILALLNYSLYYRYDLYLTEVHFNTAWYTYIYTNNRLTSNHSQYGMSIGGPLYNRESTLQGASSGNITDKAISSVTENSTASDLTFTPSELNPLNSTASDLKFTPSELNPLNSTASDLKFTPSGLNPLNSTQPTTLQTSSNVHIIMRPKTAVTPTASSQTDEDPSHSAATLSTLPQYSTTESLSHKTEGYVLVTNIYEQQTMASGNLLQLQCWASTINLAVVKPFVYDSTLSTPLDEGKHAFMLKLDDIFDMSDWSGHAKQEGYSPLVDWNDFIKYAPRKVIYAEFKYPLLSTVRAIKASGRPFPHPPEGTQYKTGCKFRVVYTKIGPYLSSKGFEVVRTVCFNFLNGDEMTLAQFNRHLLGSYAPSDVTVIINWWRGIGESQRVLIQEKICVEKLPYREQVKPSQALIRDAERYAVKYLNGDNYLAVIARFEMTAITCKRHHDQEDPYRVIPHCTGLTLEQWDTMKKDTGLNTTFLSIDIGQYGSGSFESHKYYGHLKDMTMFLTQVYGKGVREWERTFESMYPGDRVDSGYVAMLQKVIVTRAKCILFVGGGSYQRHALHLYKQLHPDPAEQCVRVVEKCTSSYRPVD